MHSASRGPCGDSALFGYIDSTLSCYTSERCIADKINALSPQPPIWERRHVHFGSAPFGWSLWMRQLRRVRVIKPGDPGM